MGETKLCSGAFSRLFWTLLSPGESPNINRNYSEVCIKKANPLFKGPRKWKYV